MADKIDRKELRKPDEFQVVASQAMGWIVVHRQKVIGGAIAAIVVALGVWGFTAWKSAREARAGEALAAALAIEQRPIAGEAAPQPGEESFPSKAERAKAVIAALEAVRKDHGGTTAARTATAELGFTELKQGDAAGAQRELTSFLSGAAGHPLRSFAQEALGYALEEQGKLDEARAAFQKLAELGLKDRADFQAGRIALLQGKPEGRAQLEGVAKEFPKAAVAVEANERLELASLPPPEPPAPAPEASPKPAAKARASGKTVAKKK